jgi:hypothetical protein
MTERKVGGESPNGIIFAAILIQELSLIESLLHSRSGGHIKMITQISPLFKTRKCSLTKRTTLLTEEPNVSISGDHRVLLT